MGFLSGRKIGTRDPRLECTRPCKAFGKSRGVLGETKERLTWARGGRGKTFGGITLETDENCAPKTKKERHSKLSDSAIGRTAPRFNAMGGRGGGAQREDTRMVNFTERIREGNHLKDLENENPRGENLDRNARSLGPPRTAVITQMGGQRCGATVLLRNCF